MGYTPAMEFAIKEGGHKRGAIEALNVKVAFLRLRLEIERAPDPTFSERSEWLIAHCDGRIAEIRKANAAGLDIEANYEETLTLAAILTVWNERFERAIHPDIGLFPTREIALTFLSVRAELLPPELDHFVSEFFPLQDRRV